MSFSSYQNDIFDFVSSGSGNGVIESGPGSGKTFTGIKMLEHIPQNQSVGFFAYNKHIADELSRRVPRGMKASTVHSLGLSSIRRAFRDVDVDEDKLKKIIAELIPKPDKYITPAEFAEFRERRIVLEKLVELCRATLTDPNDKDSVVNLAERHNIEIEEKFLLTDFHKIAYALDIADADREKVDFDEMIRFPVIWDLRTEKFDNLVIDEYQDINPARRTLLERSIATGGRFFAIGDRMQGIYGFNGADIYAMDSAIKKFNATVLPLPISYRCPKSHIELVKSIAPWLEAAPGAKEGIIESFQLEGITERVKPGDMLICRINKPLAEIAMRLVRNGIKAQVKGRAIGQGLLILIERLKPVSLQDLDMRLSDYLTKEGSKLLAKDKQTRYDLLVDKIETIRIFMQESKCLDDLKKKISSIFSDSVSPVTLSSIHKAKGLEAERIFILRPDLLPFPSAKQPWEIQQEVNVKYVALTRSKSELYFVEGKGR